ncbi:Na/Pi cotransporter family protein [Orrella daihaiensis]|uniref:Na/Pi cotransporter family protein n=1 Tax=Orrella daihaiensis TaxID=2782176 RepID=A0ABY4AM49_9BURK|nr:Na/Pi symporter [Orrella daihaiensis]UOD51389.1 Na/Pi cotransporter family protein [Orrella daihaiensis]
MTLQWTSLFGGLGLFLLGMHMLSDGLRLAAGSALEQVLARATDTRGRALTSGAVTTALVQSSSAVTVATIGFVNASLLSLAGAMWVLFGANLGTTATGWIVALAGVKLDIAATALPLIAIGALLKLGGQHKVSAWGGTVAGFGLLFYGITVMQDGFTGLSTQFQVPSGTGVGAMALQLLVGLLMTVVMQSSSASIAIALTAAQGGMIDITGAAAVVIGANVGTTVTAVLASLGATSNAKRVASAHVIFNVITASVAFVLLPWLSPVLVSVRDWISDTDSTALTLAFFNTLVKATGIVLMWPIADRLARFLKGRFGMADQDPATPVFLDQTTLPVPGLAARALASELERMLIMARDYLLMSAQKPDKQAQQQMLNDLRHLLKASETFVDHMSRQAMDAQTGEKLAELLRVRRYLENVTDHVAEVFTLPQDLFERPYSAVSDAAYIQTFEHLLETVVAAKTPVMSKTQALELEQPPLEQGVLSDAFEAQYQDLKLGVLHAGANGQWPLEAMEQALQRISAQRRALQQLLKAQRWLARAQISDS